VTPKQALYAATRAGALSQGRTDCGLIKEGFKADIVVMDTAGRPWMRPCHDMVNNLVFSAQGSDVCLTMANGQIVYENGNFPTIDYDKTRAMAQIEAEKLLA